MTPKIPAGNCRYCRAWHNLEGSLKGGCSEPDSPFYRLYPAYDKACAFFLSECTPITPFKRDAFENDLLHAYILNNYPRIGRIIQLKTIGEAKK